MSISGHGAIACQERRLNHGLQTMPASGKPYHPIARTSEFHRSINQKLPELWSDFSRPRDDDERTSSFHDGVRSGLVGNMRGAVRTAPSPLPKWAPGASASRGFSEPAGRRTASPHCAFVGFAEFQIDGRYQTAGEMDRIMNLAAVSKYPCARPATLDEYERCLIVGLPATNTSGKDVVFAGPGATGCELFHAHTHGAQKCMVPPGDPLDGQTGGTSLYGRKCCVCVYSMERIRRQSSLVSFGMTELSLSKSGRPRRAGNTASASWLQGLDS